MSESGSVGRNYKRADFHEPVWKFYGLDLGQKIY